MEMIKEIITALMDYKNILFVRLEQKQREKNIIGQKYFLDEMKKVDKMFKGLNELYELVNQNSLAIENLKCYANRNVGTDYCGTDELSITLDEICDIIKKLGE